MCGYILMVSHRMIGKIEMEMEVILMVDCWLLVVGCCCCSMAFQKAEASGRCVCVVYDMEKCGVEPWPV